MNKLVLFCKNFSKEYKDYILTKIPYIYIIEINKIDYHINYLFDKNTFGYVYGSKHDEELEKIRFNYTYKNYPISLDIDDLKEYLSKHRLT